MTEFKTRKKLIEVALPLDAINAASVRESFIYRGNPSALHKWWAQRPLAAARAILFAQMVDDPSSHPERFPTPAEQDAERQRLFGIIEELVKWESTTNEEVLEAARSAIRQSWRRTCKDNEDHAQATRLFDPNKLPTFHDPFAGGASLPLEAQRLGLEPHASDLNPVAVLINRAIIEVPVRLAAQPPVNPESRATRDLINREWRGVEGLAEDVRYYGEWMSDEAEKRIGHLYPKIDVTDAMVTDRPDLKPYRGRELTVIAWIWARTVRSPNPAFAGVEVPLTSTFMLSTKKGKEAWVEPIVGADGYRFRVWAGQPKDPKTVKAGTKIDRRASFRCLMSGAPMDGDYIKAEGKAGRIGRRLMAIVAEGDRRRIYLAPTKEQEAAAQGAEPEWRPDVEFMQQALGFRIGNYGMTKWSDLFTERQTVALTTFTDLVGEAMERARRDAGAAHASDDGDAVGGGDSGAWTYASAVATYLAFALSKCADYNCTAVPWYTKEDRPGHLFSQQAVPMVWDFAELNPLSKVGGSLFASLKIVAGALNGCAPGGPLGRALLADAVNVTLPEPSVVSTDPPYYDNVGYADLSDFFYVWLRRSLRSVYPDLFATLAVPKSEELVATPHRHGGKENAELFFMSGMTQAMMRVAEQAHSAFPVTNRVLSAVVGGRRGWAGRGGE